MVGREHMVAKKIYKSDQGIWKQTHYGMTHKKWNEWNREYRKVRPLVLERDNNTCQVCKGKSEKLFKKKFQIVVHHITKVKDGGSNELNNLVTLCQLCNIAIDHGIHKMGTLHQRGAHRPTEKQLIKHRYLISKKYQAICDKI